MSRGFWADVIARRLLPRSVVTVVKTDTLRETAEWLKEQGDWEGGDLLHHRADVLLGLATDVVDQKSTYDPTDEEQGPLEQGWAESRRYNLDHKEED